MSQAQSGCVLAFPFVVQRVDATQITLKRFSTGGFSPNSQMSFADINGDGLSDFISVDPTYGVAYGINTGVSWGGARPQSGGWPPSAPIPSKHVQIADVNGDGRADIVHPRGDSALLQARYGLPNGGITSPVDLANAWTYCTDRPCLDTRTMMFTDVDADGNVDLMRIKWDGDGSNPIGFSRPSAKNRYIPRDVITRITNGLGAETDISYAPLTNNALYRPLSGSRNNLLLGRGSPVQDVLAPMYVVSKAASTSPQFANPDAKATVHYRYQGARMQAGGRGFLGFAQIDTIDSNRPGGHVATSTAYHQSFPLIGLPIRTTKTVVGGAFHLSSCLVLAPTDACYAPAGAMLPAFSGVTFGDNQQLWETAPAWNAGVQIPTQVRTAGSDERQMAPETGGVNSRVQTAMSYGAHGNVTQTIVDTYTGESTLAGSVITSNAYEEDRPALWRLGRMTANTVTPRRPGLPDVVRTNAFAYAIDGAATGLLNAEHVEPYGGAEVNKRTAYALDEYGNRTLATTCSAGIVCGPAGFEARPASPLTVNRYTRAVFDGRGRFAVATYEPFLAGGTVSEAPTQRVLARDPFGNVTEVRDVNNVLTMSLGGTLGRPSFAWTQTSPTATPGQGGVEQRTTYRWCGSQVPCPAGAKFRQRVTTTASPTKWIYFDALGRQVMVASETFNAHIENKDVSAVCTRYDATGNTVGTSNPFFLPGTANDLAGLDAGVCLSAPHWTTTEFDTVGRVRQVIAADQTRVQTAYHGLKAVVTNARNFATEQHRNGYGEVIRTRDAHALDLFQDHDAAGRILRMRRNAGAGEVVNEFRYDVLGRKVQQIDPDTGLTTFSYNALGELYAEQDTGANRIEHAIDGRGRIWRTTTTTPNGQVETQSTIQFDDAPGGLGKPSREAITGTYASWRGQADKALAHERHYAYDTMGRAAGANTLVAGHSYGSQVVYDALGRPQSARDATGRWAKTEYTARGFASAVCESSDLDTSPTCIAPVSRTRATDVFGNAVDEVRGANGQMQVVRNYDAIDGRLRSLCAGANCELVDEAYLWDANGNLDSQRKGQRYLEAFRYDALDRLTESRAQVEAGVQTNRLIQSFAFDGLGNICAKNGVSYRYDWGSQCGTPNGSYPQPEPPPTPAPSPPSPSPGPGPDVPPPGPVTNPCVFPAIDTDGDGHCDTIVIDDPPPGGGEAESASAFDTTSSAVSDAKPQSSQPVMLNGPHAVSQTIAGQSVVMYGYDARGNQTLKNVDGSADDRDVSYTADNRAYEINAGGVLTRFRYGADGSRYLREDGAKRTYYLGNVELIVEHGVHTMKRMVGGVMQQTIVGQSVETHYLFHDRLGSVVTVTDPNGVKQKDLDYAAYGSRRNPSAMDGPGTGTPITTRGYTGHEHVDAGGLIHMNARLFDPTLGRFLQADPMVQDPSSVQGWNAYSYVLNNPLRYTDPTGMLGVEERQWLAAIIVVAAVITQQYWAIEGAAAIGFYAAAGFVSGAVATKSWQGGLLGAMSATITAGMGASAAAGGLTAAEIGVMAFTGGVMSALQGGNFGSGFISAGLTAGLSPVYAGIGNHITRTIVAAMVGGTVSELSGGNFASGALSAAVISAFSGYQEATASRISGSDSGLPPCEQRTAEVDRRMRSESQSAIKKLDHEIIGTPEMDQIAISSRNDNFTSEGKTLPQEKFFGIVGDGYRPMTPICADGDTVRSVLPRGSKGTIHPHPPGVGGEWPGPADPGLLAHGPAYFWTNHGALRVVEARLVNGEITPQLRTVLGGSSRMNAEAAKWKIGMSDSRMIKIEERVYP